MKQLFSARSRHSVWRKLWYWLAQAQKEVGLEGISDEALAQMADHLVLTDKDFAIAAVEEEKRRHDVVSLPISRKFDAILLTESWIDGS
jgi:adenylosuccinate lyase